MLHVPPLVSTIAIGLVLAFAFGVLAQRFRLPPLIGYLVAGIAIGPFTPGYVADQNIALQLAEVGVILLMFGVGLHFSLKDLLSVRAIAITGAVAQGLVATPLAMGVGWLVGWPPGAGLIFGVALSVASTVVLLRVLQERRLVETERGRVTVGWLIVQDITMVLVLVLLPGVTALFRGVETAPGAGDVVRSVAILLGQFAIFLAVMLLVGKKVIPAILHYVAHTGSRELFRLAVLSIALGAFFAGMMLSESQLSQQAATESLPLRDAFAVLFFVSVGMLFDPKILMTAPFALIATVSIILVGKSIPAFFVVRLFGHSRSAALMVAASLAQIGEFSFILADRSLALGLLPEAGRDLILAGAIISILINPLLFAALDVYAAQREKAMAESAPPDQVAAEEEAPMREPIRPTSLKDHVVLIGHGRVGSYISAALKARNVPMFVIEDDEEDVAALKQQGIEALEGNAADPEVLQASNLAQACCLLVAIPDAFEGGQVVYQAHAVNPALPIIARAHSREEIDHLRRHGASLVVMGEHEIANAMLDSVAEIQTMVERAAEARAERAPEAAMEEKPAVS